MNFDINKVQTSTSLAARIAENVKARRKEQHLSQVELAKKSGVSLGSYKRFEDKHAIALESLLRIAIALNCERDFEALFAQKQYRSIQDVIDENV